jgi:hypothetical protein
MNEHIRLLAIECYNPYGNFDTEKFANLIVNQCLAMIELSADDNPELYGVALDIADHFGIENE